MGVGQEAPVSHGLCESEESKLLASAMNVRAHSQYPDWGTTLAFSLPFLESPPLGFLESTVMVALCVLWKDFAQEGAASECACVCTCACAT